jgi:hypothetical protein
MTYPRIINRLNGDRSTDVVLVRSASSRRTISQRARWAAKAPSNGWRPVLVGTLAALQEVGAYVNTGGGWIWRDDGGFEIAVEEVQP